MPNSNASDTQTSPFHAGERAVQDRMGVRDKIETFARKAIRNEMPEQHRAFYQDLPMIFAGHVDIDGRPWASVLAGHPGFITSPDAKTLVIDAQPLACDPIGEAIAPGLKLGLLGMGLSNRRRNRVNGTVTAVQAGCIHFAVDQSFGNCPQYIQTRVPEFGHDPSEPGPVDVIDLGATLDRSARALITTASTFHVASHGHDPAAPSNVSGTDVSHRGGKPGFVRIDGNTLTIPDFAGNLHYNTVGNFAVNPRAGLLFIDYESGDILMLSGRTEIIWDGAERDAFRGAELLWTFAVERALRLNRAMPLQWAFGDYSPNTLITGDWEETQATLAAEKHRAEWRPYRVAAIVDESTVIRSFQLEPADGGGLFGYKPGQYLTIRVTPDGGARSVIRTYTLSSAPSDRHYRISVKREAAGEDRPAGDVSNHLHAAIKVGDVIEARAPKGDFWLDTAERRPAVLLAGGVGITPMISMAREVVVEALRSRHDRALTVFHAARTLAQRAFHDTFRDLEREANGRLRYVSIISTPEAGAVMGVDFDAPGRLSSELLRANLTLDDYDFFLCGPPGFMQASYDALRALGVRDARIMAEAFGPASLTRIPDTGTKLPLTKPEAEMAIVEFAKSGFEQRWSKGDAPLLELAEAHGMTPQFGCRNGTCGTCAVKLNAGEITYRTEPTAARAEGEVLICCAVPAEDSDTVSLDI